jgi:hypothetical protein
LKATPKDDDTFLYDEKGCLFLLTPKMFAERSGSRFDSIYRASAPQH